MKRLFGLILAGGEGSRLGGVRKAGLRIGGVPMINRVTAAFEDRVTELLVASGQEEVAAAGLTSIRDQQRAPTGPLAGIQAGLRHLEQRFQPDDILVTVAVDTPFLPHDYVVRLEKAASEAGAAYAAWGDNIYPTNSAWRLQDLRDALEGADESAGPKAILARLNAAPVNWSDEATTDPFANINTLSDLVALQRRAIGLGI